MNTKSDWYLGKAYTPWDTDTRPPADALPSGSCDCAVHVYDSTGQSRLEAGRKYDAPPHSSLEDMLRMHEVLGVSRAVLVQPSIYGTDHRLMKEILKAHPHKYRGVAILDDSVTDSELAQLDEIGVCSARFNLLSGLGAPWDPKAFQRNLDRVRELGWIVSLHATIPELSNLSDMLRQLRMQVVLDHLAYCTPQDLKGEGFSLVKALVAQGNWWLKVSRTDQVSSAGPPYEDTIDTVQRLVAMNPERVLWATDWPHVLYDGAMPNDGELVDLFSRYVSDPEQRKAILVDNPIELFGFPPVAA
ncbi:amidohydrolase family protein [Pollutimonas thiosulfatoxidans]|uniref:Amidohydrolase-related domain-containing protein n=1 Tax=Pollutimonas thiosulfatoxidans TaxID=2028345 RepID=A0A410GD52_9BURK|nr:amidohydrolase family protein [Pollutimonas thiosulfatoxidans]QAA94220.1 hypothetical protein CKA81_10530 [Pollutimonas thiosulfatoxidans]